MDPEQTVQILYTNYRGETSVRKIQPKRLWFGTTEWHPEPQWLLDALDLDKNADRAFAMKDIRAWFLR
jgi:predicted DNA-binding transcriptional regulator YafY